MNGSTHDQRPLFDPWFAWQELPDDIRQHQEKQSQEDHAAMRFEMGDEYAQVAHVDLFQ